jgi:hypothetical protein
VAATVALVLLGGASLTRTDDNGDTAAAVARRRSPAAAAALAAASTALPVAQGAVAVEACTEIQQRALMALVRDCWLLLLCLARVRGFELPKP